MARLQPDVVVHLAWSSTNDVNYNMDPRNIDWAEATGTLAAITADLGSWFIGAGSVIEEYASENSTYRDSKILARRNVLSRNPYATWLRPTWLLNPLWFRPSVVGEYLRNRQKNETFTLINPITQHDFMHIDDFPSALKLIINERITGVQDIGMGVSHTVLDALESIDPWARDHLIFETDQRELLPAEYLADHSRLLRAGWRPQASTQIFSRIPL